MQWAPTVALLLLAVALTLPTAADASFGRHNKASKLSPSTPPKLNVGYGSPAEGKHCVAEIIRDSLPVPTSYAVGPEVDTSVFCLYLSSAYDGKQVYTLNIKTDGQALAATATEEHNEGSQASAVLTGEIGTDSLHAVPVVIHYECNNPGDAITGNAVAISIELNDDSGSDGGMKSQVRFPPSTPTAMWSFNKLCPAHSGGSVLDPAKQTPGLQITPPEQEIGSSPAVISAVEADSMQLMQDNSAFADAELDPQRLYYHFTRCTNRKHHPTHHQSKGYEHEDEYTEYTDKHGHTHKHHHEYDSRDEKHHKRSHTHSDSTHSKDSAPNHATQTTRGQRIGVHVGSDAGLQDIVKDGLVSPEYTTSTHTPGHIIAIDQSSVSLFLSINKIDWNPALISQNYSDSESIDMSVHYPASEQQVFTLGINDTTTRTEHVKLQVSEQHPSQAQAHYELILVCHHTGQATAIVRLATKHYDPMEIEFVHECQQPVLNIDIASAGNDATQQGAVVLLSNEPQAQQRSDGLIQTDYISDILQPTTEIHVLLAANNLPLLKYEIESLQYDTDVVEVSVASPGVAYIGSALNQPIVVTYTCKAAEGEQPAGANSATDGQIAVQPLQLSSKHHSHHDKHNHHSAPRHRHHHEHQPQYHEKSHHQQHHSSAQDKETQQLLSQQSAVTLTINYGWTEPVTFSWTKLCFSRNALPTDYIDASASLESVSHRMLESPEVQSSSKPLKPRHMVARFFQCTALVVAVAFLIGCLYNLSQGYRGLGSIVPTTNTFRQMAGR